MVFNFKIFTLPFIHAVYREYALIACNIIRHVAHTYFYLCIILFEVTYMNPDTIKQFLSDNWYNVAIIISNIVTYLLTRRITISNNNKESLEHQLKTIYKPLVVYFRYHNFSDICEIKQFYNFFHAIIIENYEYVTNDLLSFESNLLLSIEKYDLNKATEICNKFNKFCTSKFNVICYKLNLPSTSNKGANLLLSKGDKMNYIFYKLLDPWFFLISLHLCFVNITDIITTAFFHFSFAVSVYSNFMNFFLSFIPAAIIYVMFRYRE